jgi:hypothetical protein
MTNMMSAEKFFRQCGSIALQKIAVSTFANHHSLLAAVLPFASRYSLLFPDLPTCQFHDLPIRFGSAGASPSHLRSN